VLGDVLFQETSQASLTGDTSWNLNRTNFIGSIYTNENAASIGARFNERAPQIVGNEGATVEQQHEQGHDSKQCQRTTPPGYHLYAQ
jgi:hypothetical protein